MTHPGSAYDESWCLSWFSLKGSFRNNGMVGHIILLCVWRRNVSYETICHLQWNVYHIVISVFWFKAQINYYCKTNKIKQRQGLKLNHVLHTDRRVKRAPDTMVLTHRGLAGADSDSSEHPKAFPCFVVDAIYFNFLFLSFF